MALVLQEHDIKIDLDGEEKKQEKQPVMQESPPPPVSEPKQESTGITGILQSANHPCVCIFHLGFRLTSILW